MFRLIIIVFSFRYIILQFATHIIAVFSRKTTNYMDVVNTCLSQDLNNKKTMLF